MKSVLQDRLQTEHLVGPNGSPDNGRSRAGSARAFFTSTTPTATPYTDALGSTTLDDGRLWVDSANLNRLWVRDQTTGVAWEQCNAGAGVVKETRVTAATTYATGAWRDVAAVSYTVPAAFNSASWQIIVDAKVAMYSTVADNLTARIYDGTNNIDDGAVFVTAASGYVCFPLSAIVTPTGGTAYTFTLQIQSLSNTWTNGYPAGTFTAGAAGGVSKIRLWFAPVLTS